ncbi:transcription factor bHLH121-like isoform X2 [Camellia sinensis]|uniref:transcription factor bHLH121-like isoform X2 n=1 Tax=Camellia sinensis TaxID=4442 RepID=UPI001035EB92|nr:transcription factor bHLH121-like isoform X2 [Camellia sinensis]
MDQWETNDFSQPLDSNHVPTTTSVHCTLLHPLPNSLPEPRQMPEVEVKDPIAARKVQKADREKLRRDRLNEHFLDLGNALDPDRPKNDKATILTDTIQVLKDLTAEVNRLKAECAALSEESRELTQEKNELRGEKASLKSDIDNLNLQYQQRLAAMFPWTTIDPSVVMASPFSYPVPLTVPPGPIPMHHPAMQPFPFFGNQNPGAIPNSCSTFIPYPSLANHHIDQPSYQCASTSRISSKQDSKCKISDHCRGSNDDKSDDSNDVVTELELKTPGSTVQQSPGERKSKKPLRKGKSIVDGSSSSGYSSSQGFQDSSSNNTQ